MPRGKFEALALLQLYGKLYDASTAIYGGKEKERGVCFRRKDTWFELVSQ